MTQLAAPASLDTSQITSIAAQYNVPPAILAALAQQSGGSLLLNQSVLAGYGMTPADVKGNNQAQVEIAARQLAADFAQYGSWERALSAYVAGDPDAYQSPTSSVGGLVYGVLGIAAAQPTLGLDQGFAPADPSAFAPMAHGFTSVLSDMHGSGGIVTTNSLKAWQSAAALLSTPPTPQPAVPGQPSGATDALLAAALQRRGLPVSQQNLMLLRTMAKGEGMNPAYFNPLATTQPEPGAGSLNSVGVREYPTFEEGVQALATTLGNGNYDNVLAGMKVNAPLTYYTQGKAADEIRTWQGGSNEDINLLRQQASQPMPPAPAKVAEFAEQLKGAGIDPAHFAQNFPAYASMRRRLLQQGTSVDDFAQVKGMEPAQIREHVMAQPHPTYPEHTAGAFAAMWGKAQLHSTLRAGRTPEPAEVAHLLSANADWSQIKDYYTAWAAAHGPDAAIPPSAPGTVDDTTKRRQGGPK